MVFCRLFSPLMPLGNAATAKVRLVVGSNAHSAAAAASISC
jgi:hypothetical protein